jgi:hypothetical protein
MGRFAAHVVLAVSLALAGCLEVEQTVELAADGSGVQHAKMVVPEQTLAAAKRASSVNQTGAADPQALFVRESVERELAEGGMQLVSHATEEVGNRRRVDIAAKFGSLAALRRSPLLGSSAEWEFTPGPVAGTVEVSLYPQGKKAWNQARERAAAFGDEVDPVAADFLMRRKEQLAGLDVTLRLRLPGKVLRYTANMEQTADNEVTARVTAAQIQTPADLMRRLAPRFQAVFDARDCSAFPLDR